MEFPVIQEANDVSVLNSKSEESKQAMVNMEIFLVHSHCGVWQLPEANRMGCPQGGQTRPTGTARPSAPPGGGHWGHWCSPCPGHRPLHEAGARPWACAWTQLGRGHGWAGAMAGQGRAVGCWIPALLWPQWGKGWRPWGCHGAWAGPEKGQVELMVLLSI